MPLKKRTQKSVKDNMANEKSESNSMGRRSSSPLIISTVGEKMGKKNSLSKSVTPIVNNCLPVVLHGKEETVPEPPGCIQSSKLTLGNVLGEGEYGFVYKGTYKVDEFTKVSHFHFIKQFL